MKLFYNNTYKKFFITNDNERNLVNLKTLSGKIVNYIDIGENVSFHGWSKIESLLDVISDSILIPSNHGTTSSKIRVILKHNLSIIGRKFINNGMKKKPIYVEPTAVNNSNCGLKWVDNDVDIDSSIGVELSENEQSLDYVDNVNRLLLESKINNESSEESYSYDYYCGKKDGLNPSDRFIGKTQNDIALILESDSNTDAYIDGFITTFFHKKGDKDGK